MIVAATTLDRGLLLALNNRHATELSPLDASAFDRLLAAAVRATAVAPADAMLIAFGPEADYDSPNFAWWRARRDRFVYVDRLVVADRARGRGLARALYADLFACSAARAAGAIVCEVNSDPPNLASDAFHAAHGFTVAGEARLADRAKSVRYLIRELPGT